MILEETFSGKKVFNGTAPVRQQWCESNAASCFPDSEWRQPGLFVCLPFLADHPGHLAHPDPTVQNFGSFFGGAIFGTNLTSVATDTLQKHFIVESVITKQVKKMISRAIRSE